MSDLPRDERDARIADDDGDPGDTVWTTTATSATSRAYHDDPDCRYLDGSDKPHNQSRQLAQARGHYPCNNCVLGQATYGTSSGPCVTKILADPTVTSIAEAQAIAAERERGDE